MAEDASPGVHACVPTTSLGESQGTIDKREEHHQRPSTSAANDSKKRKPQDGAPEVRPAKKRKLRDGAPDIYKNSRKKKRRLRPVDPLAITLDPVATPHCPPHPVLLGTVCLTCFGRVEVEENEVATDTCKRGDGGREEEQQETASTRVGSSSSSPPPPYVPLNYIEKGMRISTKILNEAVRPEALEESHRRRKLVLILDLDHTLVHSRSPPPPGAGACVRVFSMGSRQYATAVRPFAPLFLERASAMYDMYVYTLGDPKYAQRAVACLDPEGRYFHGSNVISRENCTKKKRKGLDVVLAHPSTVVILDDSRKVWKRHRGNLVWCKKYVYPGFGESDDEDEDEEHKEGDNDCDGDDDGVKGVAEGRGEEEDMTLPAMYNVLQKIHRSFFRNMKRRDVKKVLKEIRVRVLRGCRVCFCSGVDAAEKEYVGEVARHMGATEVAWWEEATHVVAGRWTEAEEMAAAREGGKFVVTARWVWSACWSWERPPEKDFLLLRDDQDDVQPPAEG